METMKNVIKSWREYLDFRNVTLAEGVAEMNQNLGTHVLPNHISEYMKGNRKIHPKIYRYLIDEIFDFSLIQCELKRVKLENLIALKQMWSVPE